LNLQEKDLERFRGRRVSLVVQDPHQGLEPTRRIGSQIKEALLIHKMCDKRQADARVLELLEDVGLKDPQRVKQSFPHQVSGGMAQRAMIAMMLASEPSLLVADEVTSALDVSLRKAILELIDKQRAQRNLAVVLISHDLELVAGFADRVMVMYAGRVVEEINGGLIEKATHPYTRGLLACLPKLGEFNKKLAVLNRDPAWLT
ncbi:MAG: ABC transporter ATP-binding protein, partial [Deltaproteobacteria bacterium]|nr:ABC transporter ATP-binding protein [Deltaproteobacteria bacterium]